MQLQENTTTQLYGTEKSRKKKQVEQVDLSYTLKHIL